MPPVYQSLESEWKDFFVIRITSGAPSTKQIIGKLSHTSNEKVMVIADQLHAADFWPVVSGIKKSLGCITDDLKMITFRGKTSEVAGNPMEALEAVMNGLEPWKAVTGDEKKVKEEDGRAGYN